MKQTQLKNLSGFQLFFCKKAAFISRSADVKRLEIGNNTRDYKYNEEICL